MVQERLGGVCLVPPWQPLGGGQSLPDHSPSQPLGYLEQLSLIPAPTLCLSQFLLCVLQEAGCSENRNRATASAPPHLQSAPPASNKLWAVALFLLQAGETGLRLGFRWGLSSGRRQEGTCIIGNYIWGAAPLNCPGGATGAPHIQ